MPVTIKDIAREAGVSHTTVSRALNGNLAIPEKTAITIRELSVEMGYLPSAAARGLKTNRSRVLGVIVSQIDNPYFGEIVQGIEDALQETGYNIFIASSHQDYAHEKNIIKAFGEHRVDGVIISSISFNNEHVDLLKKYNIPIVVINNQSPRDYHHSIAHDDVFGAQQLTNHLIGLGHRRIAYIGNSRAARINRDRLRGFDRAFSSAGFHSLKEMIIDVDGSDIQDGAQGMVQLLSRSAMPTAVFCFNDLMAIGALKHLQKNGIQVPGQISLVGFDNIPYSAYTSPSLTTFDQPKRLIGSEATRMLLGLISAGSNPNGKEKYPTRLIKGQLLIRESTGICSEKEN